MKRNRIMGIIIFVSCSSFSGNYSKTNPADFRYFKYDGDLHELIPKGEVKMTGQNLIFIDGMVKKRVTRAEKDSLFSDSTSTRDRIFKNDSWVKQAAYVPVSRNRWNLCGVETLISGRSGRSLIEGPTQTSTFMFDREGKPAAGLVRIKGTNICFILPP